MALPPSSSTFPTQPNISFYLHDLNDTDMNPFLFVLLNFLVPQQVSTDLHIAVLLFFIHIPHPSCDQLNYGDINIVCKSSTRYMHAKI